MRSTSRPRAATQALGPVLDADESVSCRQYVDGDGLGADVPPIIQCTQPVGTYVTNNSDCNDADTNNSGQVEL